MSFPLSLCSFFCRRFGNGQFAVLVLVLTMADLLTILVGLVGGLTLEVVQILNYSSYMCTLYKSPLNFKVYVIYFQVGHMAWAGDSLGCQLYYFLSSW